MPSHDPNERSQIATIGAYGKWAKEPNRTAATAPARAAAEAKFLAEADGDPKRAEALRKLHFLRMARKSAEARRARKVAS